MVEMHMALLSSFQLFDWSFGFAPSICSAVFCGDPFAEIVYVVPESESSLSHPEDLCDDVVSLILPRLFELLSKVVQRVWKEST